MASELTLTIDGREVTVPEGTTVWQAARQAGVEIPVLCHDPRLTPVGVCRLCVVDVGGRVLAASCVRPAEAGMKVDASSERVKRQRRGLLSLLMSDHPTPCAREQTTADCVLEREARQHGVDGHEWRHRPDGEASARATDGVTARPPTARRR